MKLVWMKIVGIVPFMAACALPALSQYSQPVARRPFPPQYTVTIGYCACTGGGDFSVDSGEVIVPEQLRQSYIDALSKWQKLYGTREKIVERVASNGYRVSSLRAVTPAAWDSLFTPSARNGNVAFLNGKDSEERASQGSYWRRRYRITGTVIGIAGPYPIFKIQRAVRISDKAQGD
ncbi:hypothetical protein Q5H92_17310 [Hymenobacter sp. M29]|uniref:Uncharacterized protein n=1 Tax=Hymenobacter mellowenesis TaxID=3063995 RepID=A0ABT9AE56_9BACT|nr:hypothetical protein [Hymenobacter sp. M29]MDO7848128.1 hypothetical protein [Hymenobacter sp. M29]